jgi:hypothetical protein
LFEQASAIASATLLKGQQQAAELLQNQQLARAQAQVLLARRLQQQQLLQQTAMLQQNAGITHTHTFTHTHMHTHARMSNAK